MYLNVFRHRKRPDVDLAAYLADGQKMERLARSQDGFLEFRRYAAADGEALSISEWETEQDARAWSRNAEHAAVQGRGRSVYYESYLVYCCRDPEVRRFEAVDEGAVNGIESK